MALGGLAKAEKVIFIMSTALSIKKKEAKISVLPKTV